MDERELQQLFEKLQSGVDLTDQEMRKLARDTSLAAKSMDVMGATLKHLGKQAMDVGKKLYEGQQGASVYNDAITNTTEALGNFLSALGPLGKVLGFFVKAVGGYAVEANKLSDRLYKNYQTLSQVGISAADGMTGLGDAAQRLGYSLDDAGVADFARLMKTASKDLAALSGSAFEGRKRFTEIADVVKSDAGRELQNLGASTAEINEQIAEFVGQQARIGAAQTRSNQDLRKSAVAYVKELDILAKLTGEEKNRLQEAQRAALGEQQFRARIEELRSKGEFGTIQNLQNLQSALTATAGPELARGVRDVIAANGAITTDAAAKASQVLGFRLTEIAQRALKGEDWVGLFNELAGAAGQGTKAFQGVAQFADISDTVGNLSEAYNLANRYIDQEGKLRDRLTNELVKQEQGADGVTGAATNLRRSQLDTTQSLQTLVSKGVTPLTGAMEGLAGVTNKIVKGLGGSVAQAPGGPVSTGYGAARGSTPAAATAPRGLSGVIDAGAAVGNLRIKSAESMAGGQSDPRVYALANQIQQALGADLKYFSAFNDTYERGAGSKHGKGLALDFTLNDPSKSESATQTVAGLLKGQGRVINEYLNPSRSATGGHIHAELREFLNGGIATGPRSGYAATLHGTEAVVPLPDGKTIPVTMPGYSDSMSEQLNVMGAQLYALQDLVSAMRDQNSISTKILQATNA